MRQIATTFDRVVVINLARRRQRLEQFDARLDNWPFLPPKRFEAVDGSTVSIPPEWQHGPGAWGCMLSHRQVMADALRDGVSSILVLEDDAVPGEDFSRRAADFLAHVPDDWDCLMLGGHHLSPPKSIATGILQCTLTNRAHAYAVRGRMMPVLLQFLLASNVDHCDIILAALMPHFKTYAPDPFLIGQDAGFSDITLTTERLRFLSPIRNPVPKTVTVYPVSQPAAV